MHNHAHTNMHMQKKTRKNTKKPADMASCDTNVWCNESNTWPKYQLGSPKKWLHLNIILEVKKKKQPWRYPKLDSDRFVGVCWFFHPSAKSWQSWLDQAPSSSESGKLRRLRTMRQNQGSYQIMKKPLQVLKWGSQKIQISSELSSNNLNLGETMRKWCPNGKPFSAFLKEGSQTTNGQKFQQRTSNLQPSEHARLSWERFPVFKTAQCCSGLTPKKKQQMATCQSLKVVDDVFFLFKYHTFHSTQSSTTIQFPLRMFIQKLIPWIKSTVYG